MKLWRAPPSREPWPPDAEYREVLALTLEAWERQHHNNREKPSEVQSFACAVERAGGNASEVLANWSAIDAIEYVLRRDGLTRKALEPCIGHDGRVSEVMNGKRELSKGMVRKLHDRFGIPYELLLRDPEGAEPGKMA